MREHVVYGVEQKTFSCNYPMDDGFITAQHPPVKMRPVDADAMTISCGSQEFKSTHA